MSLLTLVRGAQALPPGLSTCAAAWREESGKAHYTTEISTLLNAERQRWKKKNNYDTVTKSYMDGQKCVLLID